MRVRPGGKTGFTLIEVLVAMALVTAILLPASLWFYRTRTHRAAWDRFRAVQVLEARMHRAMALRSTEDYREEFPDLGGLRIGIDAKPGPEGVQFKGIARDKRGRVLATLESELFGEAGR